MSNLKKAISLAWALCFLIGHLGFLTAVQAAIPTTVNYQGYLTDAAGVPETSTLDAEFMLYTSLSGGNALWMESHSIDVNNGFFQVELGSQLAFPDGIFDNPVFLGISIDSDPEMTPRLRFSSVPTAFVSASSVSCSSGETNCNGECADLQADVDNCGMCGTQCNTANNEACLSGVCTVDTDADMDGFTVIAGQDCNDEDNSIFPGATELCNGIDDDCDMQTDEDVAAQPCSLQMGVCSGATAVCSGGSFAACTSTEYGPNFQATESVCDGLDNDCDGQTDETFNLNVDVSNCGSCGNNCTGGDECNAPNCAAGSCGTAPLASGTTCGSQTVTSCTNADSCDGNGTCAPNNLPNGTTCGANPNECTNFDTCSNGTCEDQGFKPSGTACGSATNTECTNADTCNGSGTCSVNHLPNGTLCTGGTCNNGVCTP